MTEETKPVEGWMAEKPSDAKRYHYIRDTMALCRGYGFYRGELEQDSGEDTPGPKDCAACFKLVKKERER